MIRIFLFRQGQFLFGQEEKKIILNLSVKMLLISIYDDSEGTCTLFFSALSAEGKLLPMQMI